MQPLTPHDFVQDGRKPVNADNSTLNGYVREIPKYKLCPLGHLAVLYVLFSFCYWPRTTGFFVIPHGTRGGPEEQRRGYPSSHVPPAPLSSSPMLLRLSGLSFVPPDPTSSPQSRLRPSGPSPVPPDPSASLSSAPPSSPLKSVGCERIWRTKEGPEEQGRSWGTREWPAR